MGRTMHYEITNSKELSEQEKDTILNISKSYNSGRFKDIWTCENFFIDPYHFYPDWNRPGGNSWKQVNEQYDFLEKLKLPHKEIVAKLEDEGWILLHNSNGIDGFTKTGGNEYNSLLVYTALIDISRFTKSIITLYDEGEFLIVPVIIKNGLAKTDIKEVQESWDYWEKSGWLIDNKYNVATKKMIQERLIRKYPDFFNPYAFCRVVDPQDFTGYPEYSAGQIMSGFDGEYWNLTNEDPEKKSYEMIAKTMKMLTKAGWKKENIKVAPNLDKK